MATADAEGSRPCILGMPRPAIATAPCHFPGGLPDWPIPLPDLARADLMVAEDVDDWEAMVVGCTRELGHLVHKKCVRVGTIFRWFALT